jgi:hypothetical protein
MRGQGGSIAMSAINWYAVTRASAKLAFLSLLCLGPAAATASGPRWVTGPPYFSTSSQPIVWFTSTPTYFTDPGDLSAVVDHAAADAIVAAAAGVWNISTANITLAQGGQLAEHVSSANVYPGSNGLIFPVDVSSANYAAIQIAVIYDSDGSVTDLLLGQGASDPVECRQNGVSESVDAISTAGAIQHALLIVNGRCTGKNPEQQLQLQYQLVRSFGRILGLAWSQTNDNVFTQTPLPTADEAQKWPVMHPIDVVCGLYTYQCQISPFTLKPDDVASLSALYFMAQGTAPQGKEDTLSHANSITGVMQFGNGQGMQGMNLLVRRSDPSTPHVEAGATISAVSGVLYRWNNGNPITGSPTPTVSASMGYVNPPLEGGFRLIGIPLLPNLRIQDVFITSEPVNPLYTGLYGLGPYLSAPVRPSGQAFPWRDNGVVAYEQNYYSWDVPGAVATCAASGLGTAAAPTAASSTGWWNNVLCGYGVSSWTSLSVEANRSLSVEVTAADEQGSVTESKLQPLIGAWNQSDPVGSLPSVAVAASPFNSLAAGLTLLNFDTPGSGPLRIAISDQRGDGRPDYAFRARILYAQSIAPSVVASGGGLVTITGLGFRGGMTVIVGGVEANVVAATANTILAIAPPFVALGGGDSLTVDIVVLDPMSGGSTTMYGALAYPAASLPPQSPSITILNPAFHVAAGQSVAILPLASLTQNGTSTPGATVVWTDTSGSLVFPSGTISVADANGLATIAAIAGPLAAGAQAVGSACATIGSQTNLCGSFVATGVDPALWKVTAIEGTQQIVTSLGILQPLVFQVTDGSGNPVIGAPVTIFQTISGYQVCPDTRRCPVAPVFSNSQSSAVSDANGLAVVIVQQIASAAETTTIAVASGTQGFASAVLQKIP